VRSVVARIVLVALLSTMISATVGVASLYLGHIVRGAMVAEAWRAWWVGDMVGVILCAPIILVWSEKPVARFHQHWAERAAFVIVVVGVSIQAFFNPLSGSKLATPFHQADLLLGIIMWAALRAGQRGTVTATFYLAVTAVIGTAFGHGAFVLGSPHDNLLALQTFMAIVAATTLFSGATVAELRIAHDRARHAQEEAVRANKAKSEFLALMSHELRTPLNAITGYCQLLGSGVYGPLNKREHDAVERIDRNQKELLGLIDEVLTFVTLENDQLRVRPEDVRVVDAFDAVEPLVRPELQRRHFVFKRDLARIRLTVHADRKGLQKILVSLLSNASKYSREGGVITIGAERVDGRVRIWVRDSGEGIPRDAITKVFDPFFQAEHGTTRRYSGVGLGLTIARELAQKMEGDVTIASTVGAGTTVSVLLPAA
jgi:signal transduction histidine kinase